MSQSTGHSRQLTTVSHHCPHGNDGWTLLCPTWSPGIAEALPGETVSTHAPGDPRSVPFPTATPRLRPQAPAAAHAPCCPPSGTANHHSAPTIPTQGFPDPRGRQVPKAQTTHFRKFGFSGTSQARLLSAAAGPSGPPGWSLPGPTSEPEAPGLGAEWSCTRGFLSAHHVWGTVLCTHWRPTQLASQDARRPPGSLGPCPDRLPALKGRLDAGRSLTQHARSSAASPQATNTLQLPLAVNGGTKVPLSPTPPRWKPSEMLRGGAL